MRAVPVDAPVNAVVTAIVKVVVDGTEVIWTFKKLNAAPPDVIVPVTLTVCPTNRPWGTAVVTVTTPEVPAKVVMVEPERGAP
jgi:hypothetical protein